MTKTQCFAEKSSSVRSRLRHRIKGLLPFGCCNPVTEDAEVLIMLRHDFSPQQKELGMEPLPATEALYQRLLENFKS
jgi:hypothetical protein